MQVYPRRWAISARPTPVLPDVGSTITPPGLSSPEASAASTIFNAIRSFTDPPGLRYSTFARTVAAMPFVTEVSLTSGVSPTRSTMCSAYFTAPSSHAVREASHARMGWRMPCSSCDDRAHGWL